MVELKRTLYFWAPLCLITFGFATYLASDSSYVFDTELLEASTLAITTQATETGQERFLHQSAAHP